MLTEPLKHEIVSRITQMYHTERIILFGSYATDRHHEDSDIDLLVVLAERGFSKTYSEKIQRRLNIAKLFGDLAAKTPLDILVYTKDEWNELQRINSSFIREMNVTGVPIYESIHPELA